jgi:hypothetical protein
MFDLLMAIIAVFVFILFTGSYVYTEVHSWRHRGYIDRPESDFYDWTKRLSRWLAIRGY